MLSTIAEVVGASVSIVMVHEADGALWLPAGSWAITSNTLVEPLFSGGFGVKLQVPSS
ncbi:hypothetical protein D3C86_2243190 [compost metagenome]